ncbi:C39 family peptidase [Novosphingobium sp. BL-8A]|uniref:C39 family peptidase n=1 Tax=Novosphingobium sp. BL-8A TaxID=3127639 RepID=UPI0037582056
MSRSSNGAACLLLAAGAMLTACASQPVPRTGSTLSLAAGDYALPVKSMAERRFLTVVRQQYDFSCGSAALATLLRYHYGDLQNEQSIFVGMWDHGDRDQIKRLGFSLLDMKRYLNARGIQANGYIVTLDDIQRTGVPGIALINLRGYKHFVVVKGIENGKVLVGDPSLGIRLIDTKQFSGMWNGILFALADGLERGKSSFGRREEWALVPRSRATLMMEPASLQALELTRAQPYPFVM